MNRCPLSRLAERLRLRLAEVFAKSCVFYAHDAGSEEIDVAVLARWRIPFQERGIGG